MSTVLNRYKVQVVAVGDELWLYLREWEGERGRWSCVYAYSYHTAKWRLSGGYIVPSMWFKPIEERVRIAVGYAVNVVKGELVKDRIQMNADALAAEWNAKAVAMFAEAFEEESR